MWPNGDDCSRMDKRAGFPEKGDGTNNYMSGTYTSGTVDTVGACTGRGGRWDAG